MGVAHLRRAPGAPTAPPRSVAHTRQQPASPCRSRTAPPRGRGHTVNWPPPPLAALALRICCRRLSSYLVLSGGGSERCGSRSASNAPLRHPPKRCCSKLDRPASALSPARESAAPRQAMPHFRRISAVSALPEPAPVRPCAVAARQSRLRHRRSTHPSRSGSARKHPRRPNCRHATPHFQPPLH